MWIGSSRYCQEKYSFNAWVGVMLIFSLAIRAGFHLCFSNSSSDKFSGMMS